MRRVLLASTIVWFCLLTVTGCAKKIPLDPFTNAGCAFFPESALADETDWSQCCREHDLAYWQGGTKEERWAADQALRECIISTTGSEQLAELMYDAVRVGGTPHFPSWYRWGYGWDYRRTYEPLTEEEKETVLMRLDEYRQQGSTDTIEPVSE